MNKEKPVTIIDIADRLGVSESTVSRAISGKGRVSDATRLRILDYIEKIGYVPNAMARGLAGHATGSIGIIVTGGMSSLEEPFFRKCIEGICEHAGKKGYDTMIAADPAGKKVQLDNLVNNRKADGLVAVSISHDEDLLKYLRETGIPFVYVTKHNHDFKGSGVTFDAKSTGLKACDKLFRLIEGKIKEKEVLISCDYSGDAPI